MSGPIRLTEELLRELRLYRSRGDRQRGNTATEAETKRTERPMCRGADPHILRLAFAWMVEADLGQGLSDQHWPLSILSDNCD